MTALALSGGRLFAGGDFTVANGAKRRRVASFDVSTGALNAMNVAVDGSISTLVPAGGRLYAGGSFQKVGGRLHPAVAAIDLASNRVVAAFNAPRSARNAKLRYQTVHAIVAIGKRILAGGDINVSRTLKRGAKRTYQFRSGLIALRAGHGTIDYGFNAHTSGSVQALRLDGAKLYVAGSIARRTGTKLVPRSSKPKGRKLKPRKIALYRNNLVALEAKSGELVRDFKPAPNGAVSAIALAGDRLYVAGSFETVGGRRRAGLAAVSSATGRPSATFSPQPRPASNAIDALLADDARVFAAGSFAGFGDVPRANLAIFPADGAAGGAA